MVEKWNRYQKGSKIMWYHPYNDMYDRFEELSDKVDTFEQLTGLSLDGVNQLLLAGNKIKLITKEEQ